MTPFDWQASPPHFFPCQDLEAHAAFTVTHLCNANWGGSGRESREGISDGDVMNSEKVSRSSPSVVFNGFCDFCLRRIIEQSSSGLVFFVEYRVDE